MEIRAKTNPGGATGAILASSAAGKKSSPSFVELRKILKNRTLALIDFLQFSKLLKKSTLALFNFVEVKKFLKKLKLRSMVLKDISGGS